ncbi:hypothetical protein CYMTET_50708 [Cymbomonas tetramitiformis]|uniref:Uncharacterized protein n=1 Tax=Cymbomonas tetramitiformis TaxID=36881 RepID=A0AAE0ET73_9CHLO|nr:hypothetical protein CYMTET_50708 [Cymbomonas tetramitiformis]
METSTEGDADNEDNEDDYGDDERKYELNQLKEYLETHTDLHSIRLVLCYLQSYNVTPGLLEETQICKSILKLRSHEDPATASSFKSLASFSVWKDYLGMPVIGQRKMGTRGEKKSDNALEVSGLKRRECGKTRLVDSVASNGRRAPAHLQKGSNKRPKCSSDSRAANSSARLHSRTTRAAVAKLQRTQSVELRNLDADVQPSVTVSLKDFPSPTPPERTLKQSSTCIPPVTNADGKTYQETLPDISISDDKPDKQSPPKEDFPVLREEQPDDHHDLQAAPKTMRSGADKTGRGRRPSQVSIAKVSVKTLKKTLSRAKPTDPHTKVNNQKPTSSLASMKTWGSSTSTSFKGISQSLKGAQSQPLMVEEQETTPDLYQFEPSNLDDNLLEDVSLPNTPPSPRSPNLPSWNEPQWDEGVLPQQADVPNLDVSVDAEMDLSVPEPSENSRFNTDPNFLTIPTSAELQLPAPPRRSMPAPQQTQQPAPAHASPPPVTLQQTLQPESHMLLKNESQEKSENTQQRHEVALHMQEPQLPPQVEPQTAQLDAQQLSHSQQQHSQHSQQQKHSQQQQLGTGRSTESPSLQQKQEQSTEPSASRPITEHSEAPVLLILLLGILQPIQNCDCRNCVQCQLIAQGLITLVQQQAQQKATQTPEKIKEREQFISSQVAQLQQFLKAHKCLRRPPQEENRPVSQQHQSQVHPNALLVQQEQQQQPPLLQQQQPQKQQPPLQQPQPQQQPPPPQPPLQQQQQQPQQQQLVRSASGNMQDKVQQAPHAATGKIAQEAELPLPLIQQMQQQQPQQSQQLEHQQHQQQLQELIKQQQQSLQQQKLLQQQRKQPQMQPQLQPQTQPQQLQTQMQLQPQKPLQQQTQQQVVQQQPRQQPQLGLQQPEQGRRVQMQNLQLIQKLQQQRQQQQQQQRPESDQPVITITDNDSIIAQTSVAGSSNDLAWNILQATRQPQQLLQQQNSQQQQQQQKQQQSRLQQQQQLLHLHQKLQIQQQQQKIQEQQQQQQQQLRQQSQQQQQHQQLTQQQLQQQLLQQLQQRQQQHQQQEQQQ